MTNSPIRFDRLPDSVGTSVTSEPFVLESNDLDLFERATWLDRAYPEDPPEYPATLVEGFLLLSMVDAVLQSTNSDDTSTMWGMNYGLDRVRFVSPVHIGDRIVATFEIAAVASKGKGYKVLRKCIFRAESSREVLMTADWWVFVLPRAR